MPSKILNTLLDYLYPPSCHLCEEVTDQGRYLCDACYSESARITQPFCRKCSEAYDGAIESDFLCPNCSDLTFDFDFARSALKNMSENHQLIIDYKYHKQFYLAGELAKMCAETIKTDERFKQFPSPVLIPVPLHWYRQMRRGFNQADELAKSISKITQIPYANALRRPRYTKTQTRLDRKARLSNLKGAFAFKRLSPHFRTAILIDDVFTTGSTASACATVLRKHAPQLEHIAVLTALRG